MDYPEPDQEADLIAQAVPALPTEIVHKMIEVAGEVRRLFVGQRDDGPAIELTFPLGPGCGGPPHPPVQGRPNRSITP